MEELKLAAIARGLMAIRKRKSGPITIMESKTGKLFGSFTDIDSAMVAISPVVFIVQAPREEVGWHSDVELQQHPRICPNGLGPNCLCLDNTAIYLCAAPGCDFRAECGGSCRGHFSQLKVFGDLTSFAINRTAKMAEEGEFNLENLPLYPRYTSLKTVIPTDRSPSFVTPGEINLITSGVIGMSIKWTGSEFLLLDKDGNILDRVNSKNEFFEDEELPETDNGIIEE